MVKKLVKALNSQRQTTISKLIIVILFFRLPMGANSFYIRHQIINWVIDIKTATLTVKLVIVTEGKTVRRKIIPIRPIIRIQEAQIHLSKMNF